MAVDEGETFEAITLGETGEKGVGEVGAKEEEVETTDETSIGKSLICAGEDPHHLDEGGETCEGGSVPKELDGALAPGSRYEECVIEITLGVEVLENVYEHFWGEMGHGRMGGGGVLGVLTRGPLCTRDDGGEGAGEYCRFSWVVVVVVGEGRRRLRWRRVSVNESSHDRRWF